MKTSHKQRSRRRGVTLMEVCAALMMIGTAALTVGPLVTGVNRAQESVDMQRVAQSEAGNLLEAWSRLPYDQITQETGKKLVLSDALKQQLPQASLATEVLPQSTEPAGKRLAIEITWTPGPGRKSPRCRLVTWVYPLPGDRR